MMTLDDRPVTVTTAGADSLMAGRLRAAALLLIASDVTPDELRSWPEPTAARKVADREIADEAEYLASRGVTKEVARRAIAEYDQGRPRRRYSEDDARREIRAVAEALLRREGPAAPGIFRQVADKVDGSTRESFLEFAATAEQLLAERGASSLN
jgi:hypothetical protein